MPPPRTFWSLGYVKFLSEWLFLKTTTDEVWKILTSYWFWTTDTSGLFLCRRTGTGHGEITRSQKWVKENGEESKVFIIIKSFPCDFHAPQVTVRRQYVWPSTPARPSLPIKLDEPSWTISIYSFLPTGLDD